MFKNYPDIMTVKQVAEALGIGINNAYKLVNGHIIGSKRIRKRILVPKICLIDYVESSRFNSY
ncbi:MAG: Helix-turn-helix domain [Oscillospiraceae bacterium]|jgi:hypothetical protein|nr:Helix-turn-helix domain [Oscillospiraceae bacterium]